MDALNIGHQLLKFGHVPKSNAVVNNWELLELNNLNQCTVYIIDEFEPTFWRAKLSFYL